MASAAVRLAELRAALARRRAPEPQQIIVKVVMPELPKDQQGNLKVNTGWRPYGGG